MSYSNFSESDLTPATSQDRAGYALALNDLYSLLKERNEPNALDIVQGMMAIEVKRFMPQGNLYDHLDKL